MGMDKQTVIGPYLEILGKLTATEIKIKRQCPSHPKLKQDDNKFCGTCGKLIESVEVPITKEVIPCNVIENDDDDLWSPEGMDSILISNNAVEPSIDWDDETDETLNLFTPEMDKTRVAQVEWFNKAYKKDIALLKEKFGDDKVQVRWGLVTYWS